MPDRKRFWTKAVLAFGVLVLAVFLFLPRLDVHRRQFGNEASAIYRLRRIIELQDRYSEAHPTSGFACKLGSLKPIGPFADLYDPDAFLVTGVAIGYRFAMGGCSEDKNGRVTQYWVSVVPLEEGVTGFRAFCTNEEEVIWYDMEGSGEKCLAARQAPM